MPLGDWFLLIFIISDFTASFYSSNVSSWGFLEEFDVFYIFFLIFIENHENSILANYTPRTPPGGWPYPTNLPKQQYYVCYSQPEPKSYLTLRFFVGKKCLKLVSVLANFWLFDHHPPNICWLRTHWSNPKVFLRLLSLSRHVLLSPNLWTSQNSDFLSFWNASLNR